MLQNWCPKRRYTRIASENLVRVIQREPNPMEGFAKTKTISPGGCRLVVDKSMGVGTDIELLILLGEQVVESKGRVIHEQFQSKEAVEIGVAFTDITYSGKRVISNLYPPAMNLGPVS